jgi:predicted hydrocarbon binding protein
MEISHKEFTHRWVKNLIECLDAHLDEETRRQLMESCGRACAHAGPIRAAVACRGNLDAWISTLAKWHGGEEYVQKDGNLVHVTCAECLCILVREGPARLPDTYCYCSLGWMKEMFGTVVGRPVEVELVESIKRGAERCRFTIRMS